MIDQAVGQAVARRLAAEGDQVLIIAGLPFGRSGSTNLLHIAKVDTTSQRVEAPVEGAAVPA